MQNLNETQQMDLRNLRDAIDGGHSAFVYSRRLPDDDPDYVTVAVEKQGQEGLPRLDITRNSIPALSDADLIVPFDDGFMLKPE